MSIQFGSLSICQYAPFPLCDLLNFPVQCVPTPIAGIRSLSELIVCALSIAAILYFILRCRFKKAAVGHLEMTIFLWWFLLALIAELIIGGIGIGGTALTYIGAIQVGATAASAVALLLNAFVGYQWIDDGTRMSLLGIFGASAVYGVVVAYLAADASFGISFKTTPQSPVNMPLFIGYFIVPAVCVVAYIGVALALVLRYLRSRRPLGLLIGAFLAFVLAALFAVFVSQPMCTGTNAAIDGRFLVTFWMTVAVWWAFRFWDSITEDSWDDDLL